jgi:hypothetical protein
VKTNLYKPLQGYTRVYRAISIFLRIRNMRTKAGGGESALRVGERKDIAGHLQGYASALDGKPQASASLGKDKQG